MPKGKSKADLVKRYDSSLGFPTEEMVKQMKDSIQLINNMKTYSDWFKVSHVIRLCGVITIHQTHFPWIDHDACTLLGIEDQTSPR